MKLGLFSHIILAVTIAVALTAQGCKDADDAVADSRAATAAMDALQAAMDSRGDSRARRMELIDSLGRAGAYAHLAEAWRNVNDDSALVYFDRALAAPTLTGGARGVVQARRALLLVDLGLPETALHDYVSADTSAIDRHQRLQYLYTGWRLCSNLSTAAHADSSFAREVHAAQTANMRALLGSDVDHKAPEYRLARAADLAANGQVDKAKSIVNEAVAANASRPDIYIPGTGMLARYADNAGERQYWLANAARAGIQAGDVLVDAFVPLGMLMYARGDADGLRWLEAGVDDAALADSDLALLRTRAAIQPMRDLRHRHDRLLVVIAVVLGCVAVTATVAAVWMWRKRRKPAIMPTEVHDGADEPASVAGWSEYEQMFVRFLDITFGYRDRLEQFTDYTKRKLEIGKTDDVLLYIKQGRPTAGQNKEFVKTFDRTMLRIFPDFVADVNRLLLPDKQLKPADGELLNNELRLLAFMRLGIDDGAHVAQVLGYSVNTVYAYRNRLRGRAINKETFEEDIRQIGN